MERMTPQALLGLPVGFEGDRRELEGRPRGRAGPRRARSRTGRARFGPADIGESKPPCPSRRSPGRRDGARASHGQSGFRLVVGGPRGRLAAGTRVCGTGQTSRVPGRRSRSTPWDPALPGPVPTVRPSPAKGLPGTSPSPPSPACSGSRRASSCAGVRSDQASRCVDCSRRVPVAQWTEQPPSKRKVAGSNPAGDAGISLG